MKNKINIGGLLFDNLNMNEAIAAIEKKIKKHKKEKSFSIALANQDILNRIKDVSGLNAESMNNNFSLILPDGFSIVAASKLLGTPLKERVAGPDLMKKMIEVSAKKGYKNFFLGAKDEVSISLCLSFSKKYPDLKIAGRYSPPFGEFSKSENEKIISMVNKSHADILWVSFGCPKQEKWILEHLEKINIPVTFGIGAAFDFLSGNVKRAPLILQKLNLEWFYRLLQEPARLWKRYFNGGINFLRVIFKQKFNKSK
jgi:N-acetylglucosaminyldiphosphoundecaprenol N-acetyl-beta-D-mannosaminyltransferase